MITDTHGNALAWSSAGSLGFKGSKKSTPFARLKWQQKLLQKQQWNTGLKTVEVTVKGPGSGREAAIRSLQATGLEVTAIRDVTPVPHNGAPPSKTPSCLMSALILSFISNVIEQDTFRFERGKDKND